MTAMRTVLAAAASLAAALLIMGAAATTSRTGSLAIKETGASAAQKTFQVANFRFGATDGTTPGKGPGEVTINIQRNAGDATVDGRDFLTWQKQKTEIPEIVLTTTIDGKAATYKLQRCFVKSWSTSGDADDRPTEEVAFYYNKIAFSYATTTDGKTNP